jgi:hypothetical protein
MAWARRTHEDIKKWSTTFRFPTDCKDAGILEVVRTRAAQSRVLRDVRLLPGRRGMIDIEVDIFENHEVGRARSELMEILPAGVHLIGGPSSGTGGMMG